MLIKTQIAESVIGCAIEVHRAIGPGLLESAYQACFRQELLHEGIAFKEQVAIPVRYRGILLDCGYRIDFVVNDELVVELKCVEKVIPIHKAQALTYLRLTRIPQALLINFKVSVLRHGITSIMLDPVSR